MASTSVPGGTTSSDSRRFLMAFSFSASIFLAVSFFVRILSRSMSLELLDGSRRTSSRLLSSLLARSRSRSRLYELLRSFLGRSLQSVFCYHIFLNRKTYFTKTLQSDKHSININTKTLKNSNILLITKKINCY